MQVQCLDPEDPLEKGWQLTPVFFPGDPMDRGAWGATVSGVAKSQTRLKRLSTHSRKHVNHLIA